MQRATLALAVFLFLSGSPQVSLERSPQDLNVAFFVLKIGKEMDDFNPYPNQAFLGLQKPRGGTLCPPSKNPVTLLRIHSSKLFLKACPKMNLLTQLWFPWKPWLGF